MPSASKLSFALKEWAAVCGALETGRQVLLLRKGGIYEAGGEFQVEHPRFALVPTYLHQSLKMLKPEAHPGFEPQSSEPAQIVMRSCAEVVDIFALKSRRQMDSLEAEHIWTPPLIDMRFSYRPENPLYLLIVQAMKLSRPVTVDNTPEYAGCKSWVPLRQPVDSADATRAVADSDFESRRQRIRSLLESVK